MANRNPLLSGLKKNQTTRYGVCLLSTSYTAKLLGNNTGHTHTHTPPPSHPPPHTYTCTQATLGTAIILQWPPQRTLRLWHIWEAQWQCRQPISIVSHSQRLFVHWMEPRQLEWESRGFTSLTVPSWALIWTRLMLSGSQTAQWGVQRAETRGSQRETNTLYSELWRRQAVWLTLQLSSLCTNFMDCKLWWWQIGEGILGAVADPIVWSQPTWRATQEVCAFELQTKPGDAYS